MEKNYFLLQIRVKRSTYRIRDSAIENAEGSHEQKRVSTLLQKVVASFSYDHERWLGLQTGYHPKRNGRQFHRSATQELGKLQPRASPRPTASATWQRVRASGVTRMQGLRLRADQPHVLA